MNNIVVLTFHTIIDHDRERPWSFLSDSVRAFENTLKILKKKGYETISLQELYDLKLNRTDDNKKRVVLNFDDGFLDNYTIVYPMLKKYGMKGTVYISPEFVDKRNIVRPMVYDDIIHGKKIDFENNWGYMSWPELKIIDESGVIDVQSHANTHTWYYSSSELKDVHNPNDKYFWLWWNKYVSKKPYWLNEYNETDIDYGFPVFEYYKSLSGKRFLPNDEVITYIIGRSKSIDLKNTGKRHEFISQLNEEIHDRFKDNIGCFEDDTQFEERIQYELRSSKNICEEQLDKKMKFLAWPGGAVSERAKEIAKELGYLAVTSKEKHYNEILNDSCDAIYRMGGWSGKRFNGKISSLFERIFIYVQLNRAKGDNSIINRIINILGNRHRKKHIKECSANGENWK